MTRAPEEPATNHATRIVVVDQQLLFRAGLVKLLSEQPDFAVVGDCAEPGAAVRTIGELRPHIVIVGLAGRPLVRMMRTLQERLADGPPTRAIVLTAGAARSQVTRAQQLGAIGVLPKAAAPALLFRSIRRVRSGRGRIGDQPAEKADEAGPRLPPPGAPAASRFGLTGREQEILVAAGRGESTRAIAARFSIAEDTVKHHLSHVFDKTGVFTRLELAVFAVNYGLLISQG